MNRCLFLKFHMETPERMETSTNKNIISFCLVPEKSALGNYIYSCVILEEKQGKGIREGKEEGERYRKKQITQALRRRSHFNLMEVIQCVCVCVCVLVGISYKRVCSGSTGTSCRTLFSQTIQLPELPGAQA